MNEHDTPANVGSTERLGAGEEARCVCGDRALSECPGEWEPGCDLGNNEKFVKVRRCACGYTMPCATTVPITFCRS